MKYLVFLLIIPSILITGFKRNPTGEVYYALKREEKLIYPQLVERFYALAGSRCFWNSGGLRHELLASIDSFYRWGTVQKKYHFEELDIYADSLIKDSALLWQVDRFYTDAFIAAAKDVYQGYKMVPWVGYDQLSGQFSKRDDELLLQRIAGATTGKLHAVLAALEPVDREYAVLKSELMRMIENKKEDTVRMLRATMNLYRWMHHSNFEKMIVVNLPDARLKYYEHDSMLLNMKIVVGQTKTPTPRFATVCDQVILYPYWYVPRSIVINEYLSRIKRDPSWIDAQNMQVIDGSGKVLDHLNMNWNSFNGTNFPYTLRQSTGCDNALGVIKFNVITPYGVYLHDTNNKTAFLSGLRYYSHGCIRLEEPLELGNKLLAGKLDTAYLQSCFRNRQPEVIRLEDPVPVFSVYMQAVVDPKGQVRYYKDIYKLAN